MVTDQSNNKETDHVFENIINMNNVEEMDKITLKINTQDRAKQNSFSSVKYYDSENDTFDYISTMTRDYGQTYKIQEENLVDKLYDHYNKINIIFDAPLKHVNNLNPLKSFYHPNIKNGTSFVVNGWDYDLKNYTDTIHLTEV
jgi:hypothetical protein